MSNSKGDPLLRGRIQDYINQNESVSIEQIYTNDVIDYLRETYPREYKRKTQFAMKNVVEKILGSFQPAKNASLPPPKSKSQNNNNNNNNNNEDNMSMAVETDNDSELPQFTDKEPVNSNAINKNIVQSYKKQKRPPNEKILDETPNKKKKWRNEETKDGAKKPLFSEAERPTARYSDLGGIEAILEEIREVVERPMTHPEIYLHLGVQPPRGVLLHGPTGCGKTLLAHGELGALFLKISAPEIVSGVSGESEAKIRQIFSQAASNAPCIIFIDEIDVITPKRGASSREMERRIVAQLLTCMDELTLEKTNGQPVMVIGATNRPDSLDQALRRSGRFDREICLGVPDENGREKILKTLALHLRLDGDFNFRSIAKKTPVAICQYQLRLIYLGFVGADLQSLAKEAATHAINRIFSNLEEFTLDQFLPNGENNSEDDTDRETDKETDKENDDEKSNINDDETTKDNEMTMEDSKNENGQEAVVEETSKSISMSMNRNKKSLSHLGNRALTNDKMRSHTASYSPQQLAGLSITMQDFEYALPYVQPSALREGFATVPDVTWEQIGSLDDVKKELELSLLAPVQHRDKFESVGLKSTSRGVLLYGPPGCGKTLVAKAMANECHLNFISVKGPELLNKYVGESEKAVRKVFERAKASSPCIIFFDELDALCPKRDAKENQVSARVVNQMLTELDGMDARKEIFIIAASNRPDMIDSAILRPGRLDNMIYLALPSPDDRAQILKTVIKRTPLAPDVDIEKLARDVRMNGYSGADIDLLHREAQTECIRLSIEKNEPLLVTNQHFERALSKVIPSVTIQEEQRYKRLNLSLIKSRLRPNEETASSTNTSSSDMNIDKK